MNLEEIYTKYNTDKGDNPGFPELNRFGHRYGTFYQTYFEKYLGKKPVILELGIFEGASVESHMEFFNNECTIVGLDLSDQYLKFDKNKYENFIYIEANSESDEALAEIKNLNIKFDIIIDDCIHTYKNQLTNLLSYSEFLKDEGIYILEDLQCNLEPRYIENYVYGLENSTLEFLVKKTHVSLLSDEQYDYLINKINDVVIWSKTREAYHQDKDEKCSITSIITFNH